MEFITPQQMMEEEKQAVARGISVEMLMENAGMAVAEETSRRFAPIEKKKAVVLAGTGNNGGDGFVAARYLSSMRASCSVILLSATTSIKTEESRKNFERLRKTSVETHSLTSLRELAAHSKFIETADIVIDAIFGTGIKGQVKELPAEAIRMINRAKGVVISVDIPSGLDPLTGEASETCVKADITITLHKAKIGLRGKGEYTGELIIVPIGIG